MNASSHPLPPPPEVSFRCGARLALRRERLVAVRVGRALSGGSPWLWPLLAPAVPLVLFVAAIAALEPQSAGQTAVGCAAVAWLSSFGTVMWPRRRHAWALLAPRLGDTRVSLESDGVRLTVGRRVHRLPWSVLDDVTDEGDVLAFWAGPLPAIAVPTSAFPKPYDAQAFLSGARRLLLAGHGLE